MHIIASLCSYRKSEIDFRKTLKQRYDKKCKDELINVFKSVVTDNDAIAGCYCIVIDHLIPNPNYNCL